MNSRHTEAAAAFWAWNEPLFASRLVELTSSVRDAASEAAVLELLHAARGIIGADQAVFASFNRDDHFGESFRFMIAGDPTWCLAYRSARWFSIDPWLQYATRQSEPVCCDRVQLETSEHEAARRLAREHGVESSLILPAPATGAVSRLGVLLLGSANAKVFTSGSTRGLRVLARALAMELQEWWVRKVRQELIEKHRLTGEDLKLLACELQGLTTKQIARLLELSPASIDSRFQRLNARLRTPNRRASARLAVEYALIG